MNNANIRVQSVVSVLFQENTFLLYLAESDTCVVVDPGVEPDKVFAALEYANLVPSAILNTHGHSDHIAGNAALKQRWPDIPLVIGHGDAYKLADPDANLSAAFGIPIVSPPADRQVHEGDRLNFSGIEWEVLETPGHSAGHVVFLTRMNDPWIVVGGDVLFRLGIGRTDFFDGNFDDLRRSIHEKLFTLPDDTLVLPGHGDATTIGDEKRRNPFVGAPAGYNVDAGDASEC